MEKYSFLQTMDIEELIALKNATTDEKLKIKIQEVLGSNNYFSRNSYSSDRFRYIDSSLDDKYKKLIYDLKISNLTFFEDLVCTGVGNNAGYQTSISDLDEISLVYGCPRVLEELNKLGVDRFWKYRNICQLGYISSRTSLEELKVAREIKDNSAINEIKEEAKYLRYLEMFFTSEENKALYEGAYNSYMYIKDYLYRLLAYNNDISIQSILNEQKEKIIITREYIQEICKHLLNLRTRITDSRLSAFNNKVRFVAKRKPDNFTDHQNQFVDLVAFGTTKDNLKSKDFSDIERLIYIPRKKI